MRLREGAVVAGVGSRRRRERATDVLTLTAKELQVAPVAPQRSHRLSIYHLRPLQRRESATKKGGSNPTTDEQQRPTSERRAHAASSTEAGNHTATNATSNKATTSPDVDGGDDVIEGVATTPKKNMERFVHPTTQALFAEVQTGRVGAKSTAYREAGKIWHWP